MRNGIRGFQLGLLCHFAGDLEANTLFSLPGSFFHLQCVQPTKREDILKGQVSLGFGNLKRQSHCPRGGGWGVDTWSHHEEEVRDGGTLEGDCPSQGVRGAVGCRGFPVTLDRAQREPESRRGGRLGRAMRAEGQPEQWERGKKEHVGGRLSPVGVVVEGSQ